MKTIAAELQVSPSSVHLWTSDIELTPKQRAELDRAAGERRGKTWEELNRRRRLAYQLEGRQRTRLREPLHQAGCMLFWAEGTKARNAVLFSNSDLEMVRFFWRFLRESFGLDAEQVSVRLNVYTGNGLTIEEIQRHWLSVLDLPETCLRKAIVDHFPTSSSGHRKHKLPFGVCTLRVNRSTPIVQHIYGAIQEYAGFEEPRWLDGPPKKRYPRKRAPGN